MNKNFPYPSKFYCPKNPKTHRHIFGLVIDKESRTLETACTICGYKPPMDEAKPFSAGVFPELGRGGME